MSKVITPKECGFCDQDITDSTGFCPIPTCRLVVHIAAASGDHGYPVEIMPECGQDRAAEAVMAIVEAAAATIADRKLDARLASRTAAQVAVDEAGQVEHRASEDDYDLEITEDRQSAHVSEEVAEEAVKLMAAIGIAVVIHPETGVAAG